MLRATVYGSVCVRAAMMSLLLLASPALAAVAQVAQSGRITLRKVRPNVSVLVPNEGSGNSIVVAGADGVFLVDTMSDTISTEFVAALTAANAGPVRYVVNTHWHHNHVGGNDRLRDAAVLLGPATLTTRLSAPQPLTFLVQQTFPAMGRAWWPESTFTDSLAVQLNGENVVLRRVSGHTDTDVIVHFTTSNVVATGDLFVAQGLIPSDLDTGGSLYGVLAALNTLLNVVPDDVVIVPGHGPIATKADLARYVAGLTATLEYVDAGRAGGKAVAALVAGPLPPAVATFLGQRGAKMIEAAYRSKPM